MDRLLVRRTSRRSVRLMRLMGRRLARRLAPLFRVRTGIAVLAIVLALPLLAAGLYRFVPPPVTIPMLGALIDGHGLDWRWRPLPRLSPHLVHAVIAAEDQRFCAHDGFDWTEIGAALDAAEDGGRLRGASTLSQQAARNVFLWTGRSWVRKGLEAGFTALIETLWPKRRIAEMHLNVAEFGPGIFGAEAAARRHFGKSADALTRGEAALLIAVLPDPKGRDAGAPGPGLVAIAGRIEARMGAVARDGLAACVFR